MTELISVIVTTYNREDALDAVLRALAAPDRPQLRGHRRRRRLGAGDPRRWSRTGSHGSACRSLHVWQEDRGFRAGEARNRAILASGGAYCIFLDGDCIPRPDFVAVHRRLAEPGWFVTGNRVLLVARTAPTRSCAERIEPEHWGSAPGWRARRRRHQPAGAAAAAAARAAAQAATARLAGRARSCNLAVWRADLDRVDGFDAAFSGWGLEDSDLLIRLLHAGVRRKDGNFATGVLHLWHPENDRSLLPDNQRRLDDVIESGAACGAERRASVFDALTAASPDDQAAGRAEPMIGAVHHDRAAFRPRTLDAACRRLAVGARGVAAVVDLRDRHSSSCFGSSPILLTLDSGGAAPRCWRRRPAGSRCCSVRCSSGRHAVGVRCDAGRALRWPLIVSQAARHSAADGSDSTARKRGSHGLLIGFLMSCVVLLVLSWALVSSAVHAIWTGRFGT